MSIARPFQPNATDRQWGSRREIEFHDEGPNAEGGRDFTIRWETPDGIGFEEYEDDDPENYVRLCDGPCTNASPCDACTREAEDANERWVEANYHRAPNTRGDLREDADR